MTASKSTNLSVPQKIAAVIAGAFMMGVMWHNRGQHGFGAMWGMFAVATALVLFIFALYGERRTMKYEMLPLTVLGMAVTVGGWGTFNSQMNGYLTSHDYYTGISLEISPYSGLAIMLILGFGWAPLFSILLGTFFSKREYKLKDYIIFVAVYYVVTLICSVSVSHLILKAINPQAVDGFISGLAEAEYDMTPLESYIKNFGSAAWAKKLAYGRNYFMSIKTISSAIGALASSLVVGIALKDKFTAIVSTLSNAACAIAITAADLVMILDSDRGFLAGYTTPSWISGTSWDIWEYATGFLYGLGLMLIIVCMPKKYTDSEENFEYSPLFKNRKISIAYNLIFTFLFLFGVVVARAFSYRFAEMFVDSELADNLAVVAVSALLFIPLFITIKKNMIVGGLDTPAGMPVQDFCAKALKWYVPVCTLIVFFTGKEGRTLALIWYPLEKLFVEGGVSELWNTGKLLDPILMIGGTVIFLVLFHSLTNKKQQTLG